MDSLPPPATAAEFHSGRRRYGLVIVRKDRTSCIASWHRTRAGTLAKIKRCQPGLGYAWGWRDLRVWNIDEPWPPPAIPLEGEAKRLAPFEVNADGSVTWRTPR